MEINSVKNVNFALNVGQNSYRLDKSDRLLGKGFVTGSLVLLSGDPGAGKSTILIQTLAHAAQTRRVLYVSGDESLQQIAARAKRINLSAQHLKMLRETSVERILAVCEIEQPEILVVHSIEVIACDSLDWAPGGVKPRS